MLEKFIKDLINSRYLIKSIYYNHANQREFDCFEILGDSFLNYTVCNKLLHTYQHMNSSDIHNMKEIIIKNLNLSDIANKINLKSCIDNSIPNHKYADTIEAMIGELVTNNRNLLAEKFIEYLMFNTLFPSLIPINIQQSENKQEIEVVDIEKEIRKNFNCKSYNENEVQVKSYFNSILKELLEQDAIESGKSYTVSDLYSLILAETKKRNIDFNIKTTRGLETVLRQKIHNALFYNNIIIDFHCKSGIELVRFKFNNSEEDD